MPLKETIVITFAFITISIFSTPISAAKQETGFLNRIVTVGDKSYKYQVYIPAKWNKNSRLPVILFLHGAGERGEDGLFQTEVGIGTAIRKYSDRFPCIVVFPQCVKNSWWITPEMEGQVLKALDQTVKEFNGDPKRIYMTGLSMGGYGTWAISARNPGKFAALVPICGGVKLPERLRTMAGNDGKDQPQDPYAETAKKIGKTPVWVFHGAEDPAVPVSESRFMVQALKATGGNVQYIEYPGVGHNSWDRAYSDVELIKWLLMQSLP